MNDVHSKKYIVGPIPIDCFHDVFMSVTETEPERLHPFRVLTPRKVGALAFMEVIIPVGEEYSHEQRLLTLYNRLTLSGHPTIQLREQSE